MISFNYGDIVKVINHHDSRSRSLLGLEGKITMGCPNMFWIMVRINGKEYPLRKDHLKKIPSKYYKIV